MSQTKFTVLYRKLWSHIRHGDNALDYTTRWKSISESLRDWHNWIIWERSGIAENDKAQTFFAAGPKTEHGHILVKPGKFQSCSEECKPQEFRDSRMRYSIAFNARSDAAEETNCWLGKSKRDKSDWIGDEMRSETAKQAPGSGRSSYEMYGAGKIISKEKNSSDCGSQKEKSGFLKSRKHQGDEGVSPGSSNCLKCPPPRKTVCVTEIEAKLPPSVQKCLPQTEECPETSVRLCSGTVTDKKRKKLPALSFPTLSPEKKYGFAASSSSSRSLPATCPSNARSSKQCSSRPSLPPPTKRTPNNSVSRCGSSSTSPPLVTSGSGSGKCPTLPTAPVVCRKPSVPNQTPPPSPPPQPVSPPPSAPSKNRCGSPPCPPPCPPPPPPPCAGPPSAPKMEALQFDPETKALNFYLLNAPTSIRKDEVLVQIVYSGVSSTDLNIMEGKYPTRSSPVILGQEFSGIACAVGSGVSHVKCGDGIAINPYTHCNACRYCSRGQFGACINEGLNNSIGVHKDGGWAEFVVVNKNQVYLIPPCLGLAQAVLVQTLSSIVNAMSKMEIPFGSDIVIQGMGVSGCLWASILHMQGHRNVTACDTSEYKRRLFQCLDLKYCILPPDQMSDVTADVVIDCTGSSKSIEQGIKMLNPQGQICIFGIPSSNDDITIQPFEITKKEARIIPVVTNANSFAKAITLAEMMGCRYLDYEKLGIQTFRLGQFEGALKMKKSEEISKVVFKIQNSK